MKPLPLADPIRRVLDRLGIPVPEEPEEPPEERKDVPKHWSEIDANDDTEDTTDGDRP